jgi:hypothetical protein
MRIEFAVPCRPLMLTRYPIASSADTVEGGSPFPSGSSAVLPNTRDQMPKILELYAYLLVTLATTRASGLYEKALVYRPRRD